MTSALAVRTWIGDGSIVLSRLRTASVAFARAVAGTLRDGIDSDAVLKNLCIILSCTAHGVQVGADTGFFGTEFRTLRVDGEA